MPSIKKRVTQTGADTFTAGTIETGLTVDGKAGWMITGISAFWSNIKGVPAADYSLDVMLSTLPTLVSFESLDNIAQLSWAVQNTAGTAVALVVEPLKDGLLLEGRVTVQPELFLQVSSSGTTLLNDIYFVISYEIVKMTDLEVMRLFAGGA